MIQFGSGQITSIGANSTLSLSGASASVQDAGGLVNSALVGLSEVDGSLVLNDGAAVSIAGRLNNTHIIDLDTDHGSGGSLLQVRGALTNSGTIQLGASDGSLSVDDEISATELTNTGDLVLYGSATHAVAVDISGSAGFDGAGGDLIGHVDLSGNSSIQFGSGQIDRIDGTLTISGTQAGIADAGNANINGALLGLMSDFGTLGLYAGATLSEDSLYVQAGTNNAVLNLDGAGGSTQMNVQTLYGGSTPFSPELGETLIALEHGAVLNVSNLQLSSGSRITLDAAGGAGVSKLVIGQGYSQGEIDLDNQASITTGKLSVNNLILDGASGQGGASVVETANLTDTGLIQVGASDGSLSRNTTITTVSLETESYPYPINGQIMLYGSRSAQDSLIAGMPAGDGETGGAGIINAIVKLSGNALLQFASGQISRVDGTLSLDGASSISDKGQGVNSALVGLTTNNGSVTFSGVSLKTRQSLTNTGTFSAMAGAFNIGGSLINQGTFDLGPGSVTAVGLVNTGTIRIAGGTSAAKLVINGPAGGGTAGVLDGTIDLSGKATLQFEAGQFTTIDAGSVLSIDGATAYIADMDAPTSNSALTGLTSIDGTLDLAKTAITTSGNLDDAGAIAMRLGASLSVGGSLAVQSKASLTATATGGNVVDVAGSVDSAGTVIVNSGEVHGSYVNTGSLEVTSGTFTIDGTLTGSGTVTVEAGAHLVYAQPSAAQTANGAAVPLSIYGLSQALFDAAFGSSGAAETSSWSSLPQGAPQSNGMLAVAPASAEIHQTG